ncbi:MAG TPA: alpha-galactosidase, partial [Fusibacter sp.]|nr:alpha-galactosidase [Fusibacter sp.]
PSAYGGETDCMTLEITLEDHSNQMNAKLYYTVYEQTDIITRRVVISNNSPKGSEAVIRRALSMMIDLPNRNFQMTTFDGGWIKETHRNDRVVTAGMHVNASTTGNSSNRHNPGFLLSECDANEENGWVYGFNLIYSGNHYGSVELSNSDLVRVSLGVGSHCFEWTLGQGESFETPEVVMTFSDQGFNGASHHMHDFINRHIIRGEWKGKERPVLCNNWEAHFFDFDEGKLLALARQAKKLGVELFVLDDGWFGKRDDDHAGLGDYTVNKKKLPRGLKSFSEKLKNMGLSFGLWFEPEMVNMDSDLYRAHPEYAVTVPGKKPTLGRHQLVLNLCMPEVQDYIVESVSRILDEADVSYVKWDMNRHMSDIFSASLANQGEFYHRYILGLYSVLDRIFGPRPNILLESCSSGGNRFDLGMLCYSPQIWASDNTDPIERLKIQGGLSYLYPPSTMGAHVSSAPHQQTLRETPLSTRFNVAAFGCLGYEMDLKYLSKVERAEVKAQIDYYKTHRQTLQFGRFSRVTSTKINKVFWQVAEKDGSKVISGLFQTMASASEGFDRLKILGLDPEAQYAIETKPQNLYVERFGALVKHILPVSLNPDGAILRFANRVYSLSDGVEAYECQA